MPKIRSASKVKFLDLIEEVSREVKTNYKKIGILCTTKTRKERLYDNLLDKVEVMYPTDEEQKEVSSIILRIIRGHADSKDEKYLERLIDRLVKSGAEGVLLACTDLANLVKNNPNTLDSTEILIESVLREIRQK